MQIKIIGKHLDVGDALRSAIEEKLQSFKERFFEGTVHGNVTVEKLRGRFLTDCTLHLATGLLLQAHAEEHEARLSAETALQHLEKQLKRYKKRLKDHHRSPRPHQAMAEASYFVLQNEDDVEDEPTGSHPPIIAETSKPIPTLSVGEAVMQLEISTMPFVFFTNSKEGRLNVVYRRADGNIGWLDPKA